MPLTRADDRTNSLNITYRTGTTIENTANEYHGDSRILNCREDNTVAIAIFGSLAELVEYSVRGKVLI